MGDAINGIDRKGHGSSSPLVLNHQDARGPPQRPIRQNTEVEMEECNEKNVNMQCLGLELTAYHLPRGGVLEREGGREGGRQAGREGGRESGRGREGA